MKLFQNIKQLWNKPFHQEENIGRIIRVILLVSIFVTFFLYIFQPSEISTIESGRFQVCLGFGLMTFIACIFYEFVCCRLFRLRGKPEHFTLGKWFLHSLATILTISFANFLYIRLSFFGYIDWQFLPDMLYGTLIVGIFPIAAIGTFSMIRQENKYQTIAEEINQYGIAQAEKNELEEISIFNISAHQIRYVEAFENYVKIGYVNSNKKVIEQTERATLKAVLEQVKGSSIMKCHRSYLVNREAIVSTSGNAQGLLLSLSDCGKLIPVSRTYVSIFRGS